MCRFQASRNNAMKESATLSGDLLCKSVNVEFVLHLFEGDAFGLGKNKTEQQRTERPSCSRRMQKARLSVNSRVGKIQDRTAALRLHGSVSQSQGCQRHPSHPTPLVSTQALQKTGLLPAVRAPCSLIARRLRLKDRVAIPRARSRTRGLTPAGLR